MKHIDISDESKKYILSIYEKLINKYSSLSNRSKDSCDYFNGVADGVNHCRKVIEGIEDDYLEDIKLDENINITKFTEWQPLYEFQIPNVKLDEFFYNIKLAGPKYTKVLVDYYKSYEQYIDLMDKKKHLYKINDLSGDIMGTEKVVFKCYIFDKEDIENIRENLVTFALSEFYNDLPDMIDVFGIKTKPLSFIDKEALKYTFQQTVTFDTTLNVISNLGEMTYENQYNGYYIWSDKKDKLTS